jgi:NADH:ubiquinone oxidoreductase subunit 5 (subunit L)/multisubunit Na+/H+ antiporter MnhA subunit
LFVFVNGFWHKNQEYNDAAKKAFIMNRIGDLGLLVGIFILGNLFSTLDYATLKRLLPVQQILICIGFLLLLSFIHWSLW